MESDGDYSEASHKHDDVGHDDASSDFKDAKQISYCGLVSMWELFQWSTDLC